MLGLWPEPTPSSRERCEKYRVWDTFRFEKLVKRNCSGPVSASHVHLQPAAEPRLNCALCQADSSALLLLHCHLHFYSLACSVTLSVQFDAVICSFALSLAVLHCQCSFTQSFAVLHDSLFDCSVDTALHTRLTDAGTGDAAATELETATSVSAPGMCGSWARWGEGGDTTVCFP